MDIYNVAVFTGDILKPIKRIVFSSKEELLGHLEKHHEEAECSVITKSIKLNKVYFGSIKNFVKTNQKPK